MSLQLATFGVFLAITLITMLVGRLLLASGRNRAEDAQQLGSRRPLALGGLTGPLAWVFPISDGKKQLVQQDLQKAGYFHRRALEEYLSVRNAALMAWTLFIALALFVVSGTDENWTPQILLSGIGVGVLIYGVPRLVLGALATSRVERIQYGLPDALDMMTMSMTGGLSLQRSLGRVSRELAETHPDLACELAIVGQQTDVGSLEQALGQFAGRINIPDVIGLTAMVRHSERLGSPIAAAFRDYADSIRRERRQRAEERGNKTSVKLLFPVIFCLAPPVYILLLGPAVLELRNFVNRENQPGGVLSQSVETASAMPVTATDERR